MAALSAHLAALQRHNMKRVRGRLPSPSHTLLRRCCAGLSGGQGPSSQGASEKAPPAAQEAVDRAFMAEALLEAEKAAELGEVPVGAVVVFRDAVIARAHNLVEARSDPTAHAELLAMQQAFLTLGRWQTPEATLYVTLEPCTQCIGTLLLARFGALVFGARSPRVGAAGSWVDLLPRPEAAEEEGEAPQQEGVEAESVPFQPPKPYPLVSAVQVREGVLATESGALLQHFFRRRRREKQQEVLERAGLQLSGNESESS